MIIDHFDIGVRKYPERVCLQTETTRLSYAQVAESSHALAHALTERGLERGHIGILCPNDPIGFVMMLGILRAGAVFVPLNTRDALEDLRLRSTTPHFTF